MSKRWRRRVRRRFRLTHAERWFDGEAPPVGFAGNGCSCSPDFAFNGATLGPACRWHDWAYQVGGDEAARRCADRAFLWNLRCCGCPLWQRWLYFAAVRFWGVGSWSYLAESSRPAVRAACCRARERWRKRGQA